MPDSFKHLEDDFSSYTDQELLNLVGDNRALSYLDRGESLDLIVEVAFRWKRDMYDSEAKEEGGYEEL